MMIEPGVSGLVDYNDDAHVNDDNEYGYDNDNDDANDGYHDEDDIDVNNDKNVDEKDNCWR